MTNTVLTEHQSACRAAHEQVQMLEHLYRHLFDGNEKAAEAFRVESRLRELAADRQVLSAKLEELDLLQTRPDPEREGLLEALTGLKRAFGGGDRSAVSERLIAEEGELLRLSEQLASHDGDTALARSVSRTRATIARLESLPGDDPG